ncbi:uncharacterized protein LOC132192485 [Neocloeon triangulifer]|uniref:uncharacterized protein LOC132192485 n=1 Tax=Neocloeon triangulifer TaxID=2078957 RepID=UPI00286EF0C3|nr:uncharacterized protein LOC132192485 [Neocloeon triangulifer]
MTSVFSSTVLVLLLFVAHRGNTLDCFTCNSNDNPHCPYEGFDEGKYTKSMMNCSMSTQETMNSVQKLLYPGFHEERVAPLGSSPIADERCVKFTASSPNIQKQVTFRGCFFNGHYSCKHIEGVLGEAGAKLVQCDLCKHKHYCNSSYNLQFSLLSVLGALVVLMTWSH